VDIKWVQPRVLDLQQLETLAKQFEVWSGSVGQTAEAVEGQRVQANQGAAELKAM